MSDPTFSDIDFKNKMALVGTAMKNILNRTYFRMFSESKRIRLDSTKSNSDLGFYIPSLIGKKTNTINIYQKIQF